MFNLLSFLLPRRCVFCRKPHQEGICDLCQGKLPWRLPPDQNGVIAPLYYRDMARFALHRYKFRGFSGYAEVFGALMAQALRGVEADAVAWIPCGFWRRWTRGYDQSRLLALSVAKRLSLPTEKLLKKTRPAKSQTKMKDDGARRRNVRGVFKSSAPARGKRVLLIDDIYTSGATMNEARGVLLSAGAAKIVLCVAAARK
jgi:ComF family protein